MNVYGSESGLIHTYVVDIYPNMVIAENSIVLGQGQYHYSLCSSNTESYCGSFDVELKDVYNNNENAYYYIENSEIDKNSDIFRLNNKNDEFLHLSFSDGSTSPVQSTIFYTQDGDLYADYSY